MFFKLYNVNNIFLSFLNNLYKILYIKRFIIFKMAFKNRTFSIEAIFW